MHNGTAPRRRTIAALAIAILCSCSGSHAADWLWEKGHPMTTFQGERKRLLRTLGGIKDLSESDLTSRWRDRAAPAEAMQASKAAIALWRDTGEDQWRDLGVRCCRAALGGALTAEIDELCARIDDRGVKNPEHFVLRDACAYLAYLHVLTGEEQPAARAARLLSRFAEVIPNWQIYVPHYSENKWANAKPQTAEGFYKGWDATGLWGSWIYSDTHEAFPLLEAYDLIHGSGALQRAGTLAGVEDMLRRHVRVQFNYGRVLGNMDGTQMRGILMFARVLGEPEWVHHCARWLRDIYRTQFYADGWWHEGTPSYHKQIHHNLQGIFKLWLQGYSDPPGFVSEADGTRFDDLDLAGFVGGAMARADAALRDIQQPNRICQVLNDTCLPQPVWWAPPMKEATSILFGCLGHGILGTGAGKGNMVQASLSFGGTHGHEHYDCLSMILFAEGHELISETRYREMDVSNTTREWHSMTAGHATVVVDGLNQTSRQSAEAAKAGCMRKKQPEDEVPGVPDSRWRWMGHGNAMNDGKLRLFNTDFDMVQVVSADGERSYAGRAALDVYRRTLALVRIGDRGVYVVDVFRVRGGRVHDYMLHACLDVPHSATFSLPLATAAGDEPLHKYIRGLRSAQTEEPWHVTFTMADGPVRLRTFMLPVQLTEIIAGDGPAMRREGVAPFIAVRTSSGDSVFVAVHHPYSGEPLVKRVELVPLAQASVDAVALRVVLPDAVDTVVISGDRDATVGAEDGSFESASAFTHIREHEDGHGWAYAADSRRLRARDRATDADASQSGVITATKRIEAGDQMNAFLTSTPLPPGDALKGHTLMVDEGGLLVQSFTIAGIHRLDGATAIEIQGEPGMTVTPGLIKLEYYPSWGIRGEARFRVGGSTLLRY